MDARLGWHFLPQSIKVFLEVKPEVAAERIYGAKRGSERENTDLEATRQAIETRTASEVKRYMDYYGIDYSDHHQYDLVVETSHMSIAEVVQSIIDYVGQVESGI
jgi:cytidylate kinase